MIVFGSYQWCFLRYQIFLMKLRKLIEFSIDFGNIGFDELITFLIGLCRRQILIMSLRISMFIISPCQIKNLVVGKQLLL